MGPGQAPPEMQSPDAVMRWRKAERERLLAQRLALGAAERQAHAVAIAQGLDAALGSPEGRTISLYFPIRAEPDLRFWAMSVVARGGRCALPVVVAPKTPLIFRLWQPGERLERGLWNIPVPAGGELVTPDVVIAPVVGFDRACYRLGYGGGYFDRTLAALPLRPRVLGVGYSCAEIATIHPQPHDIGMHEIITERERLRPGPGTEPGAGT